MHAQAQPKKACKPRKACKSRKWRISPEGRPGMCICAYAHERATLTCAVHGRLAAGRCTRMHGGDKVRTIPPLIDYFVAPPPPLAVCSKRALLVSTRSRCAHPLPLLISESCDALTSCCVQHWCELSAAAEGTERRKRAPSACCAGRGRRRRGKAQKGVRV